MTGEVFYRLQITQHLTMSPSLIVILEPSYSPGQQWVFMPGVRMRFVF